MNSREHGPCIRCGYDLRGAQAPMCPECGTPITVPIRVSIDACARAAAVLRDAGLLIESSAGVDRNDVVSVAFIQSAQPRATLWISKAGFEQACDLLEAEDIPTPRTERPLQDRSDPRCPGCGHPLDTSAPATCPRCLLEFTWVTIDEPEISRAGVSCAACGYDLTGTIAECCPECGAMLPLNVDAIVRSAAREAGFADERAGDVEPAVRQSDFTVSAIGCVGIALVLSGLFVAMSVFEGDLVLASLLGIVGAGLLILAIVVSRRPGRPS